MRTTLERPRTREVPEEQPLTKNAELSAVGEVYAEPQKRWPARHKLLAGLGVLAVAGGIGIGIATQSGDGDTSVPAASSGSANSAEYRSGLTE